MRISATRIATAAQARGGGDSGPAELQEAQAWLDAMVAANPVMSRFAPQPFVDYAVGNAWIVTSDCSCVGIACVIDADHGPTIFRLYNAITSVLLASTTVSNTVPGINHILFSSPVALTNGVSVVADSYVLSGIGYVHCGAANLAIDYGNVQPHMTRTTNNYGVNGAPAVSGPGGTHYPICPLISG